MFPVYGTISILASYGLCQVPRDPGFSASSQGGAEMEQGRALPLCCCLPLVSDCDLGNRETIGRVKETR